MTENNQLIPEKIREFLETDEGKRFFAEISDPKNSQMKYDRLNAFLNPPANVRRWLIYKELLENKIK